MKNKCRERFEKWLYSQSNYTNLKRDKQFADAYDDFAVQSSWIGWQACWNYILPDMAKINQSNKGE
jgi:hypothetical protein